jgi:hypothetical protein
MFVGTLILTYIGIVYADVVLNCTAALIVAATMLIAFSLVLRPITAKVNAFFLLQTSLGFSIQGALFYFYTDTVDQYPEGPHFSVEFFTSAIGGVGSVCSLIGIFSYNRYMKNWPYRRLIYITNVILSVFSLGDVIVLSRLNVQWGLPDHAFVLGAAALQTIIQQWMWMPGIVILAQLCPKGMEATMYALLAGCHNLGNTIAASCGALVLHLLGCEPSGQKGESKEFANLWLAALLSAFLPLLTLCLVPMLIPDARQTDKLLDDSDRDATSGSLLRTWMGT